MCRRLDGGDLHVRTLEPHPDGLMCACGATFPVLDGVPLLFRDLGTWLASEAPEALRRTDLSPALSARLAHGAGGCLARNESLIATYRASSEGPLQDWLRSALVTAEGPVLELGCGLGSSTRSDVVGLDHNFALVRRHSGVRICGDAADPPFLPSYFSTIVLANLLDSCARPALVLAQADALLRTGGRLVVTCAYAFQESVTPTPEQFAPSDLRAALSGSAALGGFRYAHEVLAYEDAIPWPLTLSARTRHVHMAQAIISRKVS